MTGLMAAVMMGALAVGAALTSGGGTPQAGGTAAGPTGEALYRDHCASCHGATGRGDGPASDSLRRPPSDLTRYALANGGVFPDSRLRRIIDGREVGAHGSVEMPVWGSAFKTAPGGNEQVARERIDRILAFLRALQVGRGEASAAARPVTSGRRN